MEKIIKLLVLFFFWGIICTQVYAETKNKTRFGFKSGVNVSTTSVSLSEYAPEYFAENKTKYKYNAGFNVGVFIDFPLIKMFSVQPEFALSIKGMRTETSILQNLPLSSGYRPRELHAISKTSLYYIELPLYIKFHLELNNSRRFIGGIGPYFAYGISGKMNSEFVLSSSSNQWKGEKNIFKEDNINFNESTWVNDVIGRVTNVESFIREPYWRKSIKRIDGGIAVFLGYELNINWFIATSCNMGLLNLLNSAEAWDGMVEGKMYNRTISISLGYKF